MTRAPGAISRRAVLSGAGAALLAAATTACGSSGSASGGASSDSVTFWSQLAGSKAEAGTNFATAFAKAHPDVHVSTSLHGSPTS